MIQAYAGEFTISSIPLEMSMNYCSHKCAYCFANLNQPGRKLDVNKTINQIKNCRKSKGLTSYLLANGYPVLLSNRVDPFATTNWRQSLSFMEMLHQNGNKIAFQTKGGQGIDEALSLLDYPAAWYISISFWGDDLRKQIEPGAPSIGERFDLIEKLISKGHHVSVGINPLVEEWLPTDDFEKLAAKLGSIGVENIWLETLHLNPKQIANMTPKEANAIGVEVLNEAKKRNRNSSYFMYCNDLLKEEGFNVFSMNQPFASSYPDKLRALYDGKVMPTHQEFINHCFAKYPNGGAIKWQEYYEFMKLDFFETAFSETDGYAYRIARNIYRDRVDSRLKTLKDVLEFYHSNYDVSKSLFQNALFDVLAYKEGSDTLPYVCKENRHFIAYFNAGQLSSNGVKVVDKKEVHSLFNL